MSMILRFWRTVRYLRPVQVYGRVWFRLVRPRPALSPAPYLRQLLGPWRTPAQRLPSLTSPNTFYLLSEEGNLSNVGWDNHLKSKLWRYNQHYFDDLNAISSPARADWHRALIADWVLANPPGRGTGWEPYPTSLRIVNWVKWALAGNVLSHEAAESLAVQARWLTRRMEWHLLGNHLFANAKALVFAGLYFDGREAERWLEMGTRILAREIPEQILPDGGHFELSPMYHALALEDMLDLVNIALAFGRIDLAQIWGVRVTPMLDWLCTMTHPDGDIALFNDSAFGIAPDQRQLFDYAERLGFARPANPGALCHLAATGYARLSAGPAVLIADLARIGPDYLPGHAHADTLSFELSLYGQRIIVNSGTSVYGTGPERLRQRGTAAHSTVVVAGQNSSEVWSGFRVARRARVDAIAAAETAEVLTVTARHDGYTRLPHGPYHSRRWRLIDTGLTVSDRLEPKTCGEAIYHLPPDVTAELTTRDAGTLRLLSGRIIRWRSLNAEARIGTSTWHPRFGQSLPCQRVELTFIGWATFELDWT